MLGFTLKRYSCVALLILSAISIARSQPLVRTEPVGAGARDFLEDLLKSIERDDKLGVMLALSQGLPVDVMDSNGSTMLMQAAKGGKLKVATYLLESGADPNILTPNGATALMLATNGGHAGTVNELLKMNADPNLRGAGIPPALTFAAAQDNVLIVQSLVKAGAKLNAIDQKGFTALEFSFLNKKSAALKFLRPLYRAQANSNDLQPSKLSNAIRDKDLDAMIRVLALGFDPNRPIAGKLPIDIAKQTGFAKGEAILIHAGARSREIEAVARL